MVHGRLWTVYEPTGDRSRPLRPVACVRANAKSIAAGKVARLDPRLTTDYSERGNRVARARRNALVVVEGCHTSGVVLRGASGGGRVPANTVIAVDRRTGRAVAEVSTKLGKKINRSRYEVMTPHEWLVRYNNFVRRHGGTDPGSAVNGARRRRRRRR